MAATKELLTGIAELLAGAGLGLSWNPAGVYAAGQTGIFMMVMPATPNRVVTLALVSNSDDVTMPLGQKMLQVRGRGLPNDPLDVGELLDPIFDVLHNRPTFTIGGQTVIQMNRQVSAPMGQDDARRFERADQYYLDVDAAPTANRPVGGSW